MEKLSLPLLTAQVAVQEQLKSFAEQLTVDESLTPVSCSLQEEHKNVNYVLSLSLPLSLLSPSPFLFLSIGTANHETEERKAEDRHDETEGGFRAKGKMGSERVGPDLSSLRNDIVV